MGSNDYDSKGNFLSQSTVGLYPLSYVTLERSLMLQVMGQKKHMSQVWQNEVNF